LGNEFNEGETPVLCAHRHKHLSSWSAYLCEMLGGEAPDFVQGEYKPKYVCGEKLS